MKIENGFIIIHDIPVRAKRQGDKVVWERNGQWFKAFPGDARTFYK